MGMILCVDVGNAAVKCACVGDDGVGAVECLATADAADAGGIDETLQRAVNRVGTAEAAMICSVVPGSTNDVIDAVKRVTGLEAGRLSHRSRLPFSIDVRQPERVGPDRLAAAAGAVAVGLDGFVVIDAGTAITVDAVHGGRFLGGLIMVGPGQALRALHAHARLLPEIEYGEVEPDPDRFDDTEPSMILGATYGAVGGILQAVELIEGRIDASLPKIVTGGHVPALEPLLPGSWWHEPHLTLLGLRSIRMSADP